MILARKYMLNVRTKPWGAKQIVVDLTLFFLYFLLLKFLKLLTKFDIEFISLLRFLSIQQYHRLSNRNLLSGKQQKLIISQFWSPK